ncbi:hypothetical protein DS745_13170 [Anaerobacillus alkaliphilus]|uniref:Uncharacterized protein n=1 Tax=Anaerobacillus alkaliphilus TaxID=1548597 RepID=A0A4Q0VS58_9BACI|nr:hypothetical protein [Anaerobacillus alkaliphilus]RXI99828.1 hypothetical protein DS745_13170 [Anaerobacillus alkaliphilus]
MTISRKERMLHIITQLEENEDFLSQNVKLQLEQAKEKLTALEETEVEQLTDKVFSKPATEQKIEMNSPEYLLHSCYDELDQLTRNADAPESFITAVQQFRYYFSIEEKDGFFP